MCMWEEEAKLVQRPGIEVHAGELVLLWKD